MAETRLVSGTAGDTKRVVGTDAAQSLEAAGMVIAKGSRHASAVYITCDENSIRYAFNADPAVGAEAVGHILDAGDSIRIANPSSIRGLRFINAELGVEAVLQVTPEF